VIKFFVYFLIDPANIQWQAFAAVQLIDADP